MPRPRSIVGLVLALACAPAHRESSEPAPRPASDSAVAKAPPPAAAPAVPPAAAVSDSVQRIAPPEVAYARGWMPVSSTGVDQFLRAHPTFDGRGVLIGILDTGIDPGVPGLGTTSTGAPKLLDLRDFSGEGAVPLTRITPAGDSVTVGGRRLGGFSRVVSLSTAGPYYGGTIAEIPLGEPPASDLNGNGAVHDTLPVVVVRAPDGWVLFADTDGNGSIANEKPVHDYLVGRETFGWSTGGTKPKITIAVNFGEADGAPTLDLVFDNGSHGTHVAGIAAGNDLYGVAGFDGVAPGAQLLGLKMANSANGGITTTGSMVRALDYALRFAAARRLPLVLNMSFGVGNEIEGQARIDAVVDSVLDAHPDVVLAISAGNDGPGLSTIGFPGSAGRALSVGATLPAGLLPPGPAGSPTADLLAYFSSRGGELARPDLVTPGVAYSSVPLWNAGDEVAQGTSMASPHAAGLAALLVSALTQERRPVEAQTVRRALMVTAQPTPGATFVDEGTGVPDVDRAYRWLTGGYTAPDVRVRAIGPGDATAAVQRIRGAAGDTVQGFELLRAADAPAASFTLKSDVPWLTGPASLTAKGARTPVRVTVARAGLKAPGAYVGTVSGWTSDTMAGPAFRLVTTVIVAAPISAATEALREGVRVPAGGTLRTFFEADSGRPFQLTVETGGLAERALAFLHEPDGMPFRDESARAAGHGPQGAEYEADARDVVSGAYECVVVAPPAQPLTATVRLTQSPLLLEAAREGTAVRATFRNVTGAPVEAEVGMHLGGAARSDSVSASGSAPVRIPFVVPAWSRGVVVDLTMDRKQWERFTDFGVTLFDSLGRQLGKQPLNYAFGRLQVELPERHGDMPVTLGLFPGFADPSGNPPWALRAAIRVYADTTIVLARADSGARTIPARGAATARFTLSDTPWPLGEKFVPLGLLVARVDGRSWTREIELGSPGKALVP